jgi:hypothetical protein
LPLGRRGMRRRRRGGPLGRIERQASGGKDGWVYTASAEEWHVLWKINAS